MFQKMYVEEPDNWQPVEEERVRRDLANYYRNMDELIDLLKCGGKVRTPFAFYRWSLSAGQPGDCNGKAS